ncbi:single-stranded DNA-binding protein [Nocardia sp. bgisy118]|uniref:single-stranded DNA-binding protein n=1 Tax=Nocardia sp. bgisy118 TaxID=3413786 RepID=UPI003F4A45DB
MATDPIITISGNLTAAPELRFTPAGTAVTNFTVASTPRVFDRKTNEFKDGDAMFMRCNAWRNLAENVAESLDRGSNVIVTGRLKQRNYETREGEKRTVVELEVDNVGPSLMFATAKVTRVYKNTNNAASNTAVSDPWADTASGSFGGADRRGPTETREPALANSRADTKDDEPPF